MDVTIRSFTVVCSAPDSARCWTSGDLGITPAEVTPPGIDVVCYQPLLISLADRRSTSKHVQSNLLAGSLIHIIWMF